MQVKRKQVNTNQLQPPIKANQREANPPRIKASGSPSNPNQSKRKPIHPESKQAEANPPRIKATGSQSTPNQSKRKPIHPESKQATSLPPHLSLPQPNPVAYVSVEPRVRRAARAQCVTNLHWGSTCTAGCVTSDSTCLQVRNLFTNCSTKCKTKLITTKNISSKSA
ncbi:uncharacterized protein LOC119589880 [Penaeus monodon]|uniref:uncharacterized protein LOC119589880 n=1 Tax=Penaeus monodon TaxID=6687 RepID=UPI0018A79C8D|nr:uncharacterized protein LOC119589880 [Penaeus monodon]